ncbi:MAG: ComF family protein [Candidatus Paceibacteria bacterium]
MELESLLNLIKDSVFPKFCVLCDKEEFWVCPECRAKLNSEEVVACPDCKQRHDKGEACSDCDKTLDRHLAVFDFKDQQVKTIIHKFKYEYVTEILSSVTPTIVDFLQQYKSAFPSEGRIIPVPLHKRRRAERGFDQAHLIAKVLKRELELPIEQALKRTKNTKQQAELKREDRLTNVKGAFEVKSKVETSKAVLVDDVFTTGATLKVCAEVLKDNTNVSDITGFTLARGF